MVEDDVVSANPALKGLKAMDIFDKTVESLTNAGVAVILNNHISFTVNSFTLSEDFL